MADETPTNTEPTPVSAETPGVLAAAPSQVKASPRPLNIFRGRSRKQIIIMITVALIVLAAIGGAAYWFLVHEKVTYENPDTRIKIIGKKAIINGVESTYDTDDFIKPTPNTTNAPSYDKSISDIQAKITTGTATTEDRIVLGQLYEAKKDWKTALQTYKDAKQTADPKGKDYATLVQYIDASINRLETGEQYQ